MCSERMGVNNNFTSVDRFCSYLASKEHANFWVFCKMKSRLTVAVASNCEFVL